MAELTYPIDPPLLLSKELWQRGFLFATGVLGSTILLKLGAIQYLELLYFGLIFVVLTVFVSRGYRTVWFRPFFQLALLYLAFSIAALALAFASLRFTFYFSPYLELLRQPVYITAARDVELIASVSAMLYMAHLFIRDVTKVRFAMRVYFWTGMVSAVYSLVSIPIQYRFGLLYGSYSAAFRLRGFYNEGGPYGLYVLSVILVGLAIESEGWEPRRRIRICYLLLGPTFIMCYSKAGILAVLTVFAINGLLARSLTRRLAILGGGLVVLVIASQIVDIPGMIRGYEQGAATYERYSHFHAQDPNFVQGRVAGAFIVPRMIAAHPLTGIGWGNYGILRNAPEYRGAGVFTADPDENGMGIIGLAADLGLPLLGFLLLCLLTPFFFLKRLGAPLYLTNLALLQPIVHLYGAQLNLTYPWIVTSFALGLGFVWSQRPAPSNAALAPLS